VFQKSHGDGLQEAEKCRRITFQYKVVSTLFLLHDATVPMRQDLLISEASQSH